MTDQSRPISRRERREMEERAAASAAPTPQGGSPVATFPSSSSASEASPDTGAQSTMSRRDRRRVERLDQPVETWTAEEERIHTGSIPTVTPEVVAQQERLARERAAAAQRDAELASGEIPLAGYSQTPAPTAVPHTALEQAGGPVLEPASAPAPERLLFPPGSLQAKAAEEHARLEAEAATSTQAAGQVTPGFSASDHPGASAAPEALASSEIPTFAPNSGDVPAVAARAFPVAPPFAAAPAPSGFGIPQEPQDEFPDNPVRASMIPAPTPPDQRPPHTPLPAAPVAVFPPAASPYMTGGIPVYPSTGSIPVSGAIATRGQALEVTAAGGGRGMAPMTGMVPMTGGIPINGGMPMVGGIPMTGGIPITGGIPRPPVEVQSAGGPRHFSWAHIGLLAAAAFALGIVVWNVAGVGS